MSEGKNLENWSLLTLAQQLSNVGDSFERALYWKQRNQPRLFMDAVSRALEQLDLTLADNRHAGQRRREISRLRDEVCRELFADEINLESAQQLQRYFMAFATFARKHR